MNVLLLLPPFSHHWTRFIILQPESLLLTVTPPILIIYILIRNGETGTFIPYEMCIRSSFPSFIIPQGEICHFIKATQCKSHSVIHATYDKCFSHDEFPLIRQRLARDEHAVMVMIIQNRIFRSFEELYPKSSGCDYSRRQFTASRQIRSKSNIH